MFFFGSKSKPGWWFQVFFMFIPTWLKWWTQLDGRIFFQMGWFNHQLAPRPLPETMDNMTNEVSLLSNNMGGFSVESREKRILEERWWDLWSQVIMISLRHIQLVDFFHSHCLFSPQSVGERIQFDEHYFANGLLQLEVIMVDVFRGKRNVFVFFFLRSIGWVFSNTCRWCLVEGELVSHGWMTWEFPCSFAEKE